MPWYILVTGMAGGLFLTFALVEWLLSGIEQQSERRSRVVGFVLSGCACLIAAGAAWLIPRQTGADAAVASDAAAAVSLLEQRYGQELELVRQVANGSVQPALNIIVAARQQLFRARMEIAYDSALQQSSELLGVRSRVDTLLSVAHQTLASQWSAAKTGAWSQETERAIVLEQLQGELQKWGTFRNCVHAGREDCLPALKLTDRDREIRQLSLWLHPYLVELSRFQESDPDLIDSSAKELARLRELFGQARRELEGRASEPWARGVQKAIDTLFQRAEQALSMEAAARRQGAWHSDAQVQAFTPVYEGFEGVMMAMGKARQ